MRPFVLFLLLFLLEPYVMHMLALLQTHGRGDFAVALWHLSRYLHTSPSSSALPYLHVTDTTPLASRCLPPNYHHLHFLGLDTVEFSFCYLIVALSASCVMLFLIFPGPRHRLPANRLLSKSITPFVFIYVKNILDTTHPPTQTCSHALQRHVCYAVSSRLDTALSLDRVTISIIPPIIVIVIASVTLSHLYDIRTRAVQQIPFFFLVML